MHVTTTIDLQPFCATDQFGTMDMRQPFVRGAFRYATNGHVALRVAADGEPQTEPPPGLRFPDVGSVFAQAWPADAALSPWPDRLYCPQCFDAGTVETRLMGVVKCLACGGRAASGQVVVPERFFEPQIAIAYHRIALPCDVLIRTLPDVRYVTGVADPKAPLPFVFDGGEGMVMGLNPEGWR